MNLGAPEIIALVLLGVLMFGPEKLPPIARKIGRVYKYLSGVANEAKDQLGKELGPGFADLSLADLNPKTFISKHLLDSEEISSVREALNESKQVMTDAGAELATASSAITGAGTELVGVLAGDGGASVPFDPEAT